MTADTSDLAPPSPPPPPVDLRHQQGPFDIVGDVHGCADELIELLCLLGYHVRFDGTAADRRAHITPPAGRRAVLVGDLVDRGPKSPDALRIAMALVADGHGFCVPGNHDAKFQRWLNGRHVRLTHGLDATVEQMQSEPPSFHAHVKHFLEGLGSHLWLDGGRLVVAHAGIRADMIGGRSDAIRRFCLYGDTDGAIDEFGLTIRYNWAAAYRGPPTIVYGHTPVAEAAALNNTMCIDTGCCFGGKLTALRWPENTLVSVSARAAYAERRRPFGLPVPR